MVAGKHVQYGSAGAVHPAAIIDLYPRRMMGCQLHAKAAEEL
jgi:hypothetical protein